MLGQGGNETITGTESRDDIYGLAGNDILNGGGGGDFIYGGDDNDTLNGGAGSDRLYGEAGNDTINGGNVADFIYGGAGADILNGDAGNDDFFISGSEGIGDTYDGGANTDDIQLQTDVILDLTTTFTNMETLRFNGFNITAAAGTGFDVSDMNRSGAGLLLGTALGGETITGTSSGDTIYGYAGADTLNGFVGSDIIYGGDDNDIINGGDGNDTIRGEAGADILNGDAGSDNFYIGGTDGQGDTYNGGDGSDDIYLESNIIIGNSTTFTNMERTVFGGFSITAITNEGFDLTGMTRSGAGDLLGQGGSETISGTESNDNIYGLEGADILNGNAGADNFFVGGTEALGDIFNGGANTDDIELTADTDFNSANSFTSIERLYFRTFDVNVTSGSTVDFSSMARGDGGNIYGAAGNETISAMTNGSFIYGLDGDDTLIGGIGADDFYGGAGADTLTGGANADDFYIGGTEAAGDNWDGGDGGDDIWLTSNVIVDNSFTFTNMERVVFGGFNITVDTNQTLDLTGLTVSGTSVIYDSAGVETIYGLEGNDDIYSGDGSDILHGNGGTNDFFVSGVGNENEEYYGGAGNDYIRMLSDMTYGSGNVFSSIRTIYNNGFDINIVAGATIDFSSMLESGAGFIVGTASIENITGFNNNDQIRAGGGADIVSMGNGNDSLYVSGSEFLGDVVDGGAGTDYVRLEADTLINGATTMTNITSIIMNGFNLIVDTNETVNLTGLGRVSGGQLHGSAGNETITGFNTGTYIYGMDGNDSLTGNIGNDRLFGGNGDDILYDTDGIDYLYGDAGADTFVFDGATSFNDVDRVYTFSLADDDKLDISDLLSGYTFGVDDITDFVQIADSGANSLLRVDTTGTGDFSAAQIATIYGAPIYWLSLTTPWACSHPFA